jgi:hypothetical protein
MIRRDYILRMIEEFVQVLARINALRKGQLWQEVDSVIDAEFKQLVGTGVQAVSQMSETELLAKIIQGEPTQVVHYKTRLLTALLNQAGEIATAQNRLTEGRACYLKGLNLLLETMASSEISDFPDIVPTVEGFVIALQGIPLPLSTQARLMQHYERIGSFGKAEDTLYAMLEAGPNEQRLLEFGVAFYQRLANQSDTSLSAGNLSRTEVNAGLTDLERRSAALVPP